jgi:conjugal transfer/type IV secretion protein DotA/TraY
MADIQCSDTSSATQGELFSGGGDSINFDSLFLFCEDDKSLSILSALYGEGLVKRLADIDFGAIDTEILSTTMASAMMGNAEHTIIVGMLGIFNVAIIALASIYLLFTLVFGVGKLTSQKTQQQLGQDAFSSYQSVIRLAIGGGALLPIQGGLSILQAFILWVIILGSGVANKIEDYAVQSMTSSGSIIDQPMQPETKQIVADLTKIHFCKTAYNELVYKKADGSLRGAGYRPIKMRKMTSSAGDKIPVSLTWGTAQNPEQCGRVIFSHNHTGSKVNPLPNETDGVDFDEISNDIKEKYYDQFKRLNVVASSIAKSAFYYHKNKGSVESSISARQMAGILSVTAMTYQIATKEIVASSLSSGDLESDIWSSFQDNARRDGWIYFGAWYYRLSNFNDTVAKISNKLPTVVAPSFDKLDDASYKNMEAMILFYESIKSYADNGGYTGAALQAKAEHAAAESSPGQLISAMNAINDEMVSSLDSGSQDSEGSGSSGKIMEVLNASGDALRGTLNAVGGSYLTWGWNQVAGLVKTAVSAVLTPDEVVRSAMIKLGESIKSYITISPEYSPIVQVKKLGDSIVSSVEAAFISIFTLAGLGALAGGTVAGKVGSRIGRVASGFFNDAGSFLGGIIGTVGALAIMALVVIYIFGLILATYIPMVPVIIWITAVMGWIAATVEAMMAAPLWAVAHMKQSGEGVISDDAKQGWLILLSVFLRPAMMVIALIFAMGTSYVVIGIVNDMFSSNVVAININSIRSASTNVAVLFVYMTMILTVMHTSYYMVHQIPNSVIRFLGGGQESIGESFREDEKKSEQQIVMLGNKSEHLMQGASGGRGPDAHGFENKG